VAAAAATDVYLRERWEPKMAEHLPFIQRKNRYASPVGRENDLRLLTVPASRYLHLVLPPFLRFKPQCVRRLKPVPVLISCSLVASGAHFVFRLTYTRKTGLVASSHARKCLQTNAMNFNNDIIALSIQLYSRIVQSVIIIIS